MVDDRKPKKIPAQHQNVQPGDESEMRPPSMFEASYYHGSGKLRDKVALITGGDSGIGRAVSVYFAKEGADIAIVYLNETVDAGETKRQVEQEGRRCLLIQGDLKDQVFCGDAVEQAVSEYGQLNVLVNNAAVQFVQENLDGITPEQLENTFRTNMFAMFFVTQAALPHLKRGDTIVNTASITAFRGSSHLIDYASTKGAIVAFTRSLAANLVKRGIRVNAVAPGPIWTPLIAASFSAGQVAKFGQDTPIGRPGQPEEMAPAYVYLASEDSSYMTGETLHPDGGARIKG